MHDPTSPLHLPYTSPTSPLHLPHISPTPPPHLAYTSPTSRLSPQELAVHDPPPGGSKHTQAAWTLGEWKGNPRFLGMYGALFGDYDDTHAAYIGLELARKPRLALYRPRPISPPYLRHISPHLPYTSARKLGLPIPPPYLPISPPHLPISPPYLPHTSPYLPHTSPHLPGQEARPRTLPRRTALVGRPATLRGLLAPG